jgi:3-hydroxyisobutyrate dehydrogenase-like beta-hydroxyacid dehydrogenase
MMSTLPPEFCRKIGAAAKAKEVAVLDAPVAGGPMGAERGQLAISVGGPKEVLEKYRPILETMGTIVHCGDLGMGQVVKLANNMVAMINPLVAAEAVSWGMRNGASEDVLVKSMRAGSANSWILQNWEYYAGAWSEPSSSHYGKSITVKDLGIALRLGGEIEQPCPFAALACEFWKAGGPRLPRVTSK